METVISIIGLVFDVIIGILGFFIAYMQFRIDRREKRKADEEEIRKEEERSTIKKIIENTDSMQDCSQLIEKSINDIVTMTQTLNNSEQNDDGETATKCIQYMVDNIDDVIIEFKKCHNYITDLYKQLLVNEERFSLSYGYDRYINVFRQYLNNSKKLENELIKNYNTYISSIKEMQQAEYVDSPLISEQINKMSLIVLEMGKLINQIVPYINELGIKYSCITSDSAE